MNWQLTPQTKLKSPQERNKQTRTEKNSNPFYVSCHKTVSRCSISLPCLDPASNIWQRHTLYQDEARSNQSVGDSTGPGPGSWLPFPSSWFCFVLILKLNFILWGRLPLVSNSWFSCFCPARYCYSDMYNYAWHLSFFTRKKNHVED